jgi:two-component system chemotaxis response regulator CheY
MRFLIVDDDPKNLKLLKAMVSKFGECETVDHGEEAISAFKKAWENWRPFSLILLDILMPEMDGLQVLDRIRKIEKDKKVSHQHRVNIIMVTGLSEKDMVHECLRKGCDDFILKPINSQLLFDKVNKLVLNE